MIRDGNGRRKYLTGAERDAFIAHASALGGDAGTFCLTVAATGCRLSEALELTVGQLDFGERVIVFRCLKKRRADVYRSVPVPAELLAEIRRVHGLERLALSDRLWPWSRGTGWARIKQVMHCAGIVGSHASPKGLRHAFGVAATQRNIPLNVVQKWLGHANIEMTAIYADAVGEEERAFATRLWSSGNARAA